MKSFRLRLYQIIADPPEGDTLGQWVQFAILALIALNVTVGLLETVKSLYVPYKAFFFWFEAASVAIFTVEYILRVWACTAVEEFQGKNGRLEHMLQPMSLVDLFAVLPFYLQLLVPGLDLRFIRVLRLLRLLRLFRFSRIARSFQTLGRVIGNKKEDLFISIVVMMLLLIISANVMYIIEHEATDTKFTSVPAAMWWGMITITTIGYGDMFPTTAMGRFVGMVVAFLGVCVFALPVAILGSGFMEELDRKERLKEEYTEEFRAEQEAKRGDVSGYPQVRLTESQMDKLADLVAERLAEKLKSQDEE